MNKLPKDVTAYKTKQQKAWRERKRAAGLIEVSVWIPGVYRDRLALYVGKLQREYAESQSK